MTKPTQEELANLSRLYNERRTLKNLKKSEEAAQLGHLYAKIKLIREEINSAFDPLIEKNGDAILAIKTKFHMRNYRWDYKNGKRILV